MSYKYAYSPFWRVYANNPKQLRNKPLCLKLHDYYSSHEKPLPISIEFLSKITGSVNKQKAGFKAKIKIALEELVKIGFLRSYSIKGDMVNVERSKIVQINHS